MKLRGTRVGRGLCFHTVGCNSECRLQPLNITPMFYLSIYLFIRSDQAYPIVFVWTFAVGGIWKWLRITTAAKWTLKCWRISRWNTPFVTQLILSRDRYCQPPPAHTSPGPSLMRLILASRRGTTFFHAGANRRERLTSLRLQLLVVKGMGCWDGGGRRAGRHGEVSWHGQARSEGGAVHSKKLLNGLDV